MPHLSPQRAISRRRVLRTPKRIKPTILVAEDSPDSREMMRVLLRLKGYNVIAAETGPTAVAAALMDHPDLILLDLQLPELDGLSVTRNLRCHAEFRSTPIIIVSGHDPSHHRQHALDAGCTDYLLKPIDFDRLDTILQSRAPISRYAR